MYFLLPIYTRNTLIHTNNTIQWNTNNVPTYIHNFGYLDKPECKRCTKALQELENIDDEADQLDIGFVKVHDEALADEYNLGALPALVYYRHQTPILYEGCNTFCKWDKTPCLNSKYYLFYSLYLCRFVNFMNVKIHTHFIDCIRCSRSQQCMMHFKKTEKKKRTKHLFKPYITYCLSMRMQSNVCLHWIDLNWRCFDLNTNTGELSKEEDVLEWLIENKSTGDDEEIIEDVTAKTLTTLISNVDNLVVLFCK